MKITSSEANKLLKKLNEDLEAVYAKEKRSATFLATLGEDVESVRPAYDFAETQKEIAALQKKILAVKHALNKFNTETVIGDTGLTIDAALIYVPLLTSYKERLAAKCAILPKQREASYGIGKNAVIDYRYANYNVEDAEAAYERATEELAKIQVALDLTNSTIPFEVAI